MLTVKFHTLRLDGRLLVRIYSSTEMTVGLTEMKASLGLIVAVYGQTYVG
jgi:hypothetical protein